MVCLKKIILAMTRLSISYITFSAIIAYRVAKKNCSDKSLLQDGNEVLDKEEMVNVVAKLSK
jgi:hypothetical protein